MKQLQYKYTTLSKLEIKEEDGKTFLEGYGAFFNNVDSHNDKIKQGAFEETITGENKERIAFCYQHRFDEPIGKIVEIREDEQGLFIKVFISASRQDIATMVKEEILKEMSIGYVTAGSENNEDGTRTLTKIKLYEISLVTRASNPLAKVTGVKSITDSIKEIKDGELNELYKSITSELIKRAINKLS